MPLEMLLLDELEEPVCYCLCCLLAQRHIVDICLVAIIVLFKRFVNFCCCDFCCVSSALWWQSEFNEMLHHDAIRRKRTKLGCKIFGCLHKLARRGLDIVAPLLQSPALSDPFL